jgi:paraquat-inducible protein A
VTASVSALHRGLWQCLSCERLHRAPAGAKQASCTRCGAMIHARKTASLARSTAFLAAAVMLYVPANMLPVITSGSIFGTQADTILSGVMHLWRTGSGLLAVVLFIASVIVPGVKLSTLGFLIWAAHRRWTSNPRQRALIYRATAYIGRWSMVDIYVGAVLVALVQFRVFVAVEPAPGAIAFAGVVVLTMLASMSFDPRLSWDSTEDARG